VGSYDNKLYCLNAASGRIKWTFKTDAQVNATAALTKSNMVLISGCDGKLRVLDPTNGIQRAAISLGGNIGASPAVSGSRAFVGTLTGIYAAMNTGTGKLIWKMQEHGDDAQCYASAAVTANAVVFASRSGQVFRIDPKSGRATWSYRAPTAYNSSPVIAGNVIWQGSDDGVLAAIDLATGHKLFSFTAGNAIKGSPALASGRLLIGTTGGTLYCLGK
jgi:outer membrane protein assembly factor BamB